MGILIIFACAFLYKHDNLMASVKLWFLLFASVNAAQSGSQHKAWINWWEACSGVKVRWSCANNALGSTNVCVQHHQHVLIHPQCHPEGNREGKEIFCKQILLSKWRKKEGDQFRVWLPLCGCQQHEKWTVETGEKGRNRAVICGQRQVFHQVLRERCLT